MTMTDRLPQFPLYIPSKGRADNSLTSDTLTWMGIPHNIIVEPQEVDAYRKARAGTLATIVELDMSYKHKYELLDDHGLTKSTGPGPARNFAWDHSIAQGHDWHWVMDDNIRYFYRYTGSQRLKVKSPKVFRYMEDFALRYTNVGMAGPNYTMFIVTCQKYPPFITNTRIYSCNLIRNDVPFRWRGRYNEDTILSLDMIKAGWCTIQFNAFLQGKLQTQAVKGGNTDEFYHVEGEVKEGQHYATNGTLAKSKMQVLAHPDVSELTWRYGRVHHYVNYKQFQGNPPLIRKADLSEYADQHTETMKVTNVERIDWRK